METRRNKNHLPKPITLAPAQRAPSTRRAPLDYKEPNSLMGFLTEGGKILPRRSSGLSLKDQKKLKITIKRSRILALLPFVKRYEDR